MGCAARTPFDRGFLSSEFGRRVDSALPSAPPSAEVELPPQVSLADGLSEGESVAVALWNNAAFHSDLAELGVARADLVEAGLLPNPILSVVFPGDSNSREGTLSVPIQLLQRPTRICEHLGWRLGLTSAPGKGTIATLDLGSFVSQGYP